jgi:hypothetical protein
MALDIAELQAKVAKGELSLDECFRQMQDEAKRGGNLVAKAAAQGGISVYGLQRTPVTLYVEQWVRLFEFGNSGKMAEAAFKDRADIVWTKGAEKGDNAPEKIAEIKLPQPKAKSNGKA